MKNPRELLTDSGTTVAESSARLAAVGRRREDILDELLAGCSTPEDVTGPNGLLRQLTAAVMNRALQAEMTEHLGYRAGEKPSEETTNRRNGIGKKVLRSDQGPLAVEVPRDREGTFEPRLIPKHQREAPGFSDKIISMYGRGMSVREIRAHMAEIYGVDVSADFISSVTDEVIDEVTSWQCRPLERVYLVVYLDALIVKIRDGGVVQNKAIYVAVGVDSDGEKDVLGLWVQVTEGAKFWMSILGELRNRGVADILVLCADGLTGLPEAVEATYPKTIFQTCIVHVIRASTRYVPWNERRAVCADLRRIYAAATEPAARKALEDFDAKWGRRFPNVVSAWRNRWAEIIPFLAFPPEIRHCIYTTNTIEGLNRVARKALKTRGHLPNDEAALKLVFLAIRNSKMKKNKPPLWTQARSQFAILFADRLKDIP